MSLNGIYKDVTSDPDKNNIIYISICHCDSVYIGRTSQSIHIRRNPHVTNALRNKMKKGISKSIKSAAAIGQHFLNNLDCSMNYNDNILSIVTRRRCNNI